MSDEKNGLQRITPMSPLSTFRLKPGSLGEAMEMAKLIAGTELCPKAYRQRPADCIVAYEYGAALGLSWLQSLRSVSVINGQAALWGDAVPALILGSGECERFHEEFKGEPFKDDFTAVCIMRRKGLPDETIRSFSVADAKQAGLWGKQGPWTQYSKRMLQLRARGFAARDAFADKLSGLILAEEAMDYPDAIDATVVSSTPAASVWERIPEGLRDNIEKAFEMLALAPGIRLVKINEFLGAPDVDPEVGATGLLAWCRDEYARRKTGQPVNRNPDNGKKVAPPATVTPPPPPPVPPPSVDASVAAEPPSPPREDPAARVGTAAPSVAATAHPDNAFDF